ncbi:MAG: hypothetical protein IPG25_04865 [Proteobacteria bacterium]|nr:hypothetical protein [Pseudomonadota bacterium]
MFSAMFLFNAALQAVLLVWLVRIWRQTGAAAAALLLLPQALLIWDNLIVGSGHWIGFGDLLQSLSWPRFWGHWLCGAWLIIASGAILRLAGFSWAQERWVMGTFCLVTLALMAYELPNFWTKVLLPVCEYDLIRYSTSVSAQQLCSPEQAVVAGGGPPIPQLVTVLVVMGAGLVLAIKRKFPWLFIGGLLMFISATPPFMRYKMDNVGEVMICLGAIWAIAHFADSRNRVRLGASG